MSGPSTQPGPDSRNLLPRRGVGSLLAVLTAARSVVADARSVESAMNRCGSPWDSIWDTASRIWRAVAPAPLTRGRRALTARPASSPSIGLPVQQSLHRKQGQPGGTAAQCSSSRPPDQSTRRQLDGRRGGDVRQDARRPGRDPAPTATSSARSLRQTTQRRPFAGSKASRRPTGNASTTSLEPRGFLQNMQVRYIASSPQMSSACSAGYCRRMKSPSRGTAKEYFPCRFLKTMPELMSAARIWLA